MTVRTHWLAAGLVGCLLGGTALAQDRADGEAAAEDARAAADGQAAATAGEEMGDGPTEAVLARRIDELASRPRADELIGDALTHARTALVRARERRSMGLVEAAERARQVAWAAISLATKRYALLQERLALREAAQRLEVARARAQRARASLESAIRLRRETQETGSAAPVPRQERPPEEDEE